MPGYIKVGPYMSALKFSKKEDAGRKIIAASSKFIRWKKALEVRFGLTINIFRNYGYRERFEAPSDKIFRGVMVSVGINH